MTPDVNLKSYYLQYISNANTDIIKYKENLSQTLEIKEELHNYIERYIDTIKEIYNIDLLTYDKEWVNMEYNIIDSLYNKCIKLINNVKDDSNRVVLIQLVKYCNILRVENKYNQLIILANNRKNIKFRVYTKYVVDYYNKVHKTVLEGMGYKFSYGIGVFCINHWKLDKELTKNKKLIDFAATNARKKELLSKGIKLYNENEAAWYAARKIPYDGVDYRIYKQNNSIYDITFIKSDIFTNTSLDFKRSEYIALKCRGMSYTDIADKMCKTIEDVYNMQLDIRYKLNIILYKDPNKYLNFIRNAEQSKYQRGAHNS